MDYAEWLELEREILARDRAAFVGERPLAGWEIDGRKAKQYVPEIVSQEMRDIHKTESGVAWTQHLEIEWKECP